MNLPTTFRSGRTRPLVAIVSENAFTEAIDLLAPYSILKQSGVADVWLLSTRPGNVRLFPPQIEIVADATLAEFDSTHPEGPDIVIVPAIHRERDELLGKWIAAHAQSGAILAAVCDGAWVLAHAGLLKGREVTSHWYRAGQMQREFKDVVWVADRRYIVDERLVTSSGVSAALPLSVALVEAIGGTAAAAAVASSLHLADWSARHSSGLFSLQPRHLLTAIGNKLRFWKPLCLEAPINEGIDELSYVIAVDAWSRTWRHRIRATVSGSMAVSRNGVKFVQPASAWCARNCKLMPLPQRNGSEDLFSQVLGDIAKECGRETAEFVALQLEHASLPNAPHKAIHPETDP